MTARVFAGLLTVILIGLLVESVIFRAIEVRTVRRWGHAAMSAMLDVRVWRGGEDGAFQSFAVPRQASQTVLDVVTHIQRTQDATLAYRFACRVGMCGSCAMMVNGAPRWTCRTRVARSLDDGDDSRWRRCATCRS